MKIAVLLEDTNMSDLNYHVMTELNNRIGSKHDVFVLTNNVSSKVIKPDFAVMNISNINNVFDGVIIATSLSTARILNKTVTNSRKILFLYQLEWLYSVFDYEEVFGVLNSDDLAIIARSHNHKKLLKQTFNVDVASIVSEFDLEEIWNSLENIKTS